MPTQILTTLEYVGLYPGPGGIPAHHFGVTAQVAATATTVTAAMESLYKPWTWQNIGIQIWPVAANGTLSSPLQTATIVAPNFIDSAGNSVFAGPVDPILLAELNQHYSTAQDYSWNDPQAAPDPSKPDQGISVLAGDPHLCPWPSFLAQLSRYPFPIPHLLNLSYIVRIDAPPAGANPVPVVVSAAQSYVAAISFTTNAAGGAVVYSAAAAGAVVAGPRYTISYTNQADSTCICNALAMPATAPDRLVTPSLEPSDWQTHLTAGAADLFDFSARLIRPVRVALDHDAPSPATPPSAADLFRNAIAGDFGSLCYAVLCAQRDIVSYGVQAGPNGKSLLDQLCDQWVSEASPDKVKSDERTCYSVQLKAAMAAAQTVDTDELWLGFLRGVPAFAASPILALPQQATVYDPTAAYPARATVTYAGVAYTARNDMQQGPRPPAPAPSLWSTYPTVQPQQLNAKLQLLEHLQLLFSQNDVLAQLLVALWTKKANHAPVPFVCIPPLAGPSTSTYQYLFQSFVSSASSAMSTWNVRGMLLLGNLGSSWPTIVASAKAKADLSTKIATEWARRFTARFNSLFGVSGWPFSTALQPYFNTNDPWLIAQLGQLVPIPTATQPVPLPLPTRTSSGLALHLDTLNAPVAETEDLNDSLRTMSGFCVLLRDDTAGGPWRCLNLANPQTTTGGAPAATGLGVPVVVASPQHIQDQMRRSIVSYNSQPLMARSPVHGFSDDLLKTQDDVAGRLITYIHPSVAATAAKPMDPAYKIPGLTFGHTYRFKIGTVSNSGALPPSFAAPGQPTQLYFPTIANEIPLTDGTQAQYLRTVPVGELSFQSKLGTDSSNVQKIKFPPIPADVQPRAVELFPPPLTVAAPGSTALPIAAADPLILLTSYTSPDMAPNATANFTLYIRKPAVDLLTWDRWRARDTTANAERAKVWTLYHTLARQENASNVLGLDDPAMSQMKVEVDFIKADGTVSTSGTQGIPVLVSWGQPTTPSTSGTRVQDPSTPITFTCAAISSTAPTQANPNPPVTGCTFPANAINIQLLPGDIARVRLTPIVPAEGVALFSDGILKEKSYTFLVETANSAMPTVAVLQSLFKVIPPPSSAEGHIQFQLPVDTLPQVRAATLQTQLWRWDGRPTTSFQFNWNLAKPDPELLKWEVNAFATRAATDIDTRSMTLANINGSLNFTASDDLSTELGALYYRSSIQVFNRYGSLVAGPDRSISTFDPTTYSPGGTGGWTRTLVKARLQLAMTVPKPAIKFILPLTGTTSVQQSAAASVLVVVQGPWYSLAGLAEDIRVKIVASGNNSAEQLPEVGPDPIVWTGNALPSFQTYDIGARATAPKPYELASSDNRFHGPVGHTFDGSDTNPLWVNTSFVLDPPPTGTDTLPWTFAQVSFCRSIRRDGVLPAPQTGHTGNLESEWTEPVWVQFLPSSFDGIGKGPDLSTCTLQRAGTNVVIKDVNQQVLLFTQPASDARMTFILLLTEEVPDLLGRKGQERFKAACTVLTAGSAASWVYQGSLDRTIGRILGVQRKPGAAPPPNSDALWSELFPLPDMNKNSMDSTSRIVSISPPIQGSSNSCTIDPWRT